MNKKNLHVRKVQIEKHLIYIRNKVARMFREIKKIQKLGEQGRKQHRDKKMPPSKKSFDKQIDIIYAPDKEERMFYEELYSCTNSEERHFMLTKRILEYEFYPLVNTIKDEVKFQKVMARLDIETISEERPLMLTRRILKQVFYPLLNTIEDEEKLQKVRARIDKENDKICKRLAEIRRENTNV